MRYLIDTNIFVYLALDIEMLSRDVKAILEEPDTLLYISAESVRELIVGYRNKGLCSNDGRRWKLWWRPSKMNFMFRFFP